MKTEARKVVLMARTAALTKKHALGLNEAKIKVMKEKLEIETDLDASEAEINVLESFEKFPQGNPVDEMNMYLEEQQRPFQVSITTEHQQSAVDYASINVIPKTLLQNTMQSKQYL